MNRITLLAVCLMSIISLNVNADEAYTQALNELAKTKIAAIVNDAVVQSAVKAQNSKHAGLTQADIDALDKKWRAETKAADKPLINATLSNALSKHLTGVKNASDGLYTEIFVMDNKGLNVGQSDLTSDYWQGDEAKWQKTYSVGPNVVHIGKLQKDESTQQIQVQLSVSVSDIATKAVIGAITLGINLDNL